nr:hypothetical protein [uncultured Brevundimonas sp.]
MIKVLIQLALMPLPWPLRRYFLSAILGYRIAPSARIRWSVVVADTVDLGPGAHIGSLTYVKGLTEFLIEKNGRLGNLNWVTGLPKTSAAFFKDQPDRRPALVIRSNAAITHRHLIDCSDLVEIGEFTTFGGWGSQILTHSIDINESRQRSAPVRIGKYCFIGTRVVFLKGSVLPDNSILGAGSVLASAHSEPFRLYSGVPAKNIRPVDAEAKYFKRSWVGVD